MITNRFVTFFTVLTFSIGAIALFNTPYAAASYSVQPWDNALLTKVYDRIDELLETNPDRLVRVYDSMHLLQMRYGSNPKSNYFLTKITDYLTERLYRATHAPTFVCLADRVQWSDTVTLQYRLSTDQWTLISLSSGDTVTEMPLSIVFNAWKGHMISWVDEAVYGMRVGAGKWVLLRHQEAYGPFYQSLLIELPRAVVAELVTEPVTVWSSVTMTVTDAENTDSVQLTGRVTSLNTETVTVDFNAPLAWESLQWILIVEGLFKHCTN